MQKDPLYVAFEAIASHSSVVGFEELLRYHFNIVLGAHFYDSDRRYCCPNSFILNLIKTTEEMDALSADLFVRILSFLGASDVTRALAVNKMFRVLCDDEYLWQSVCNSAGTKSLRSCLSDTLLRLNPQEDGLSRLVARRLEACSELDKVKWLRLRNSEHNRGPLLEKMEAHTATAILNRFVVVVGGWCNSSDNRIDVIDGGALQTETDEDRGGTPLPLITLPTFTENTPSFRYGFSTTEYKGRLIVLGGCRGGGYSNDCNNCYFVDLRFHCAAPPAATTATATHTTASAVESEGEDSTQLSNEEEVLHLNKQFAPVPSCAGTADLRATVAGKGGEEKEPDCADWQRILATPAHRIKKVVARYSANLSLSQAQGPITRAYHTAAVAQLDSRDTLLVWGGLHRRAPTSRLQFCDLVTHTWRDGVTQGEEPTPRFGHSCVPLLASDWDHETGNGECVGVAVDRLVITGGSDGNDLVRNGTELREIHILNIVRGRAPSADVLVWSTPTLSTVPAGLSPAHSIPGRCHCAVQMGKRVLFFGGAADSTNTVYALAVPPPPSSRDSTQQAVIDAILNEDETSTGGYSLHLPGVASLLRGRLPVQPQRHQGLPRARLSAATALVGRYWLVVGGFSVLHREMGDVWALDTAYGTSSSLVADRKGVREARAAARSEGTGLDFIDGADYNQDEEWGEEGNGSEGDGGDGEEEEWGDEDEDGNEAWSGPVIGGQPLVGPAHAQQQALVLTHLISLGVFPMLTPQQAYELLITMNEQSVEGEGEEEEEEGSGEDDDLEETESESEESEENSS